MVAIAGFYRPIGLKRRQPTEPRPIRYLKEELIYKYINNPIQCSQIKLTNLQAERRETKNNKTHSQSEASFVIYLGRGWCGGGKKWAWGGGYVRACLSTSDMSRKRSIALNKLI